MEEAKILIKEEIIDEARQLIIETTDELVHDYVDNAQVQMLKTIQDQMTKN